MDDGMDSELCELSYDAADRECECLKVVCVLHGGGVCL